MPSEASWIGTVWSYRAGRTLIGKVTSMSGDFVTLAVAGLDGGAPPGIEVMQPEDGAPRVRVDLHLLVDRWKRMGPSGP